MTHPETGTLHYTLTADEIASGLKRASRRVRALTPIPGWVNAFFWLAIILLAFATFHFLSIYNRAESPVSGELTLFALLFFLGLVSIRVYWRMTTRLIYRHLANQGAAGGSERTVSMGPDFLTLQTLQFDLRVTGSLIDAVEENGPLQLVQIYLGTGASIDVPYRAFASEQARHDFVVAVRTLNEAP